MIYFNPFGFIIETNYYLASRIVRTGFWQKLSDTYTVLFGKTPADIYNRLFHKYQYASEFDGTKPKRVIKPNRLGILSYASLFLLPLACELAYEWVPALARRFSPKARKIIKYSVRVFLELTIIMPMRIIAMAIAVACIPILYTVNFFTSWYRNHLQTVVKDHLQISPMKKVERRFNVYEWKEANQGIHPLLKNYLAVEHRQFEDLRFDIYAEDRLRLTMDVNAGSETREVHALTLSFKDSNNKNRYALAALFKLNPNHITEYLEQRNINLQC